MHNKEKLIITLIILSSWTAFLFVDAVFYAKKIKNSELPNIQSEQFLLQENLETHSSANIQKTTNSLENLEPIIEELENENSNEINRDKQVILDTSNISESIHNTSLLEEIYKKDPQSKTLGVLIQDLLSNYQFDKAREYIKGINIFEDNTIDANTYLYYYANSLSATDSNSITRFVSALDQISYKSLIDSQSYIFYQGLIKLWKQDYKGANLLFKQIKSAKYTNFVSEISDAIKKFELQKGAPEYYKDALIGLVCLKNGYFSLANKLAVDSILKNEDYILPYQITAYSNFMTQRREKSISNFYELIEIDTENKDMYMFYIGVSQYYLGQNQDSIHTLSQITKTEKYKTDAYRYLLLNYKDLGDQQYMIQTRKKLLGQTDLNLADFKLFYDTVFYKPFASNQDHKIYKNNKQLSYDFVSLCYEYVGKQNDVCLYGEVGLDITQHARDGLENKLDYLSKNYNTSYIYQALGEYYRFQNLDKKAKTYYLKAVSLTKDILQKGVIESRIIGLD